jgi:hypothetical protein
MLELSRDRGLLKLIVNARLKGIEDAGIVEMLIASGYDGDLARRATASSFEYLIRANALLTRRLKKLKSLLDTKLQLKTDSGEACITSVKASDLREDTFRTQYYYRNYPLHIRHAEEWFAGLSAFSIRSLRERFPNEPVEVMTNRDNDPHYEMNLNQHRTATKLGQFLDRIVANTGNDCYMVANNRVLQNTALSALLSELAPGPDFLNAVEARNWAFLWIGPGGTKTPLHHDRYNILFLQVEGTKRFYLVDPFAAPLFYNVVGVYGDADLEKAESATAMLPGGPAVLSFEINAGDALFIPVLWWHQVHSITPSVSISFGNFMYHNQFDIRDE